MLHATHFHRLKPNPKQIFVKIYTLFLDEEKHKQEKKTHIF